MKNEQVISIVVPFFNEETSLNELYSKLKGVESNLAYTFEYVFVNDGSSDGSKATISNVIKNNTNAKLLNFSRNFGKEMATTAGVNQCTGVACIIIDADLQHPPKYIPEFIKKWESGADVVVGIRKSNQGEGWIKKYGSKLFYSIINRITDTKMVPNSTDFRLIDRVVIDEFNKLSEHNRITRGLVDWLGYDKDIVYFDAEKRSDGAAGYNFIKLTRLAFNGFISLSLFPLQLAGYLGIAITLASGTLGLVVLFSKYIFSTSWGLSITGTAVLAIILVFLIGIVLICLGLIALYIANIYQEVIKRPLYVIKRDRK